MPKKAETLQKYGAPLYAIQWSGNYGFMCGGGNMGIENKCVPRCSKCFGYVLRGIAVATNNGLQQRRTPYTFIQNEFIFPYLD